MLPSDQRDTAPAAPATGAQPGLAAGPALPSLQIAGLVVTKAALVAVLRLYVPQLADIAPLDGDRYLLSVAPPTPSADGGPP